LGHRRIATCLEHAKCSRTKVFQVTTPPLGVRRWGSNPLAGEEARRRKRQGTHPPPRLHGFGRSHPNPMLITACLLHNAVRAGLIFAGISTLVIFAGITAKVRARSAHVRVPGECACLLPCIPSSGGELAQQEAAMASRCSSSTTRLLTDPCSLACLLAHLLACSARSDQTASLASAAGMSDDPPLAQPAGRQAAAHHRYRDPTGASAAHSRAAARGIAVQVSPGQGGSIKLARAHTHARTHARHQGRHISRRSPEPFPNMRNSRNGEKGRYKGL